MMIERADSKNNTGTLPKIDKKGRGLQCPETIFELQKARNSVYKLAREETLFKKTTGQIKVSEPFRQTHTRKADKKTKNRPLSPIDQLKPKQQANPEMRELSPQKDRIESRDKLFPIDPMSNAHLSKSTSEQKIQSQQKQLKRWIKKVFTQTFSIAFNAFSRKEMNFEQTKTFCSMNILQNMARQNEKIAFSITDLVYIDDFLQRDFLILLQKKYPLTDSQETNRELERIVQEIDNMGALDNNYFTFSEVVFEYRQGGNYNDLIMRMMNDVVSRIDVKSKSHQAKGMTNYQDFKNYMTTVFSHVEEEEEDDCESVEERKGANILDSIAEISKSDGFQELGMNQVNNSDKKTKQSKARQIQKQNYKNKVREYTHYSIGRKIPESVQLFSEKEIESMNMKIKSPTILRILTKWCEQLRQKFTTPNYYSNNSDHIKVQRGTAVNSLLFPMRRNLDSLLREQEIEIELFLEKISANNYSMQLQLLRKEIERSRGEETSALDEYDLQQICGRYSIEIINNLHSYLIAYLNRLIHGLNIVAKKFFENKDNSELKNTFSWPSPPNLLTFSMGDLMRCKISSKQRQIVRIYEQIRQISNSFPEKMKIIRVKNRLKKSTNDILINVKFNSLIISQIQLAVKTSSSDFILCSNQFCHYLYELERSHFGFITELCNIWVYLQPRADIFRQQMDEQAEKQVKLRTHECESSCKRTPYDRPFICYTCEVAYYHNNYIISHHQCLGCNHIICAKCQLKEPQVNFNLLISNKVLRKNCQLFDSQLINSNTVADSALPEFGVCIYIQSKLARVEQFRSMTYSNVRYILGRNGKRIYEIEKIQTNKQLAAFLRNYIVFRLANVTSEHLNFEQQEAISTYILPKMLKEAYQKERESIMLGDGLDNSICGDVLSEGSPSSKQKVKKLFLDHNKIEEIGYIAEFKNLNVLELSYNPIRKMEEIESLKQLRSLSLVHCELGDVPSPIYKTYSLEELYLSHNSILVVDKQIAQLTHLKVLDLSHNVLIRLPKQIGMCHQIITLRCENNVIDEIPLQISGLHRLESLFLKGNKLKHIPDQVSTLQSLRRLDLEDNLLESIPQSLANLNKLNILNLSGNHFAKITDFSFESLEELDLSRNVGLEMISFLSSNLWALQILNINGCFLKEVPHRIGKLSSLRQLHMASNILTSLKDELGELKGLEIVDLGFNGSLDIDHQMKNVFQHMNELREIRLNNNSIGVFPSFCYCQKLAHLNLGFNKLKSIEIDNLNGLDNLEYFNVSNNLIESANFGAMMKLLQLDLSHNKLEKIYIDPSEAEITWPVLTAINLSYNNLRSFPQCLLKGDKMGSLQNLRTIEISHNSIDLLPDELSKHQKLKMMNFDETGIMELSFELGRFFVKNSINFNRQKVKAKMSPNKPPRPPIANRVIKK